MNFYVSCEHGEKHLILLGPFETHYEALKWVDVAKAEVSKIYASDPNLPWYGWGTCSSDAVLKANFNYLLERGLPKHKIPQLPNRRIPLGEEKRLKLDPTRPYDSQSNPIVARTWRVVGHPVIESHCVYIQPVGCDGFKTEPKKLAIRFWEDDQE